MIEEEQVIEVEVTRVFVEEIQGTSGYVEATDVEALESVYRIGIREEHPTFSMNSAPSAESARRNSSILSWIPARSSCR